MQHAQRETYEESDFIYKKSDMSDTAAAYSCGLKGISYLGISSPSTDLAFLQGRAARNGQPPIDGPVPPHSSHKLAQA